MDSSSTRSGQSYLGRQAKMPLAIGWLAIASILTAGLMAQAPKEEKEVPAKKPDKEELEVPGKKPGEEEVEPDRASGRPRPTKPADLAREAQLTKNPALKELYGRLAVPHDRVTKRSGHQDPIEPLTDYLGTTPDFTGVRRLQPFNEQWRKGQPFTVSRKDIQSIEYYEQYAINQVTAFLKKSLDREAPGTRDHLTRLEMLRKAEDVLGAVLNYHLGAIERSERVGPDWQVMATDLRGKLLEVRRQQLRAMTKSRDWLGAFEYANELAKLYAHQKEVFLDIAQMRLDHAEDPDQKGKGDLYVVARQALERLDSQFPRLNEAESIREKLRARAEDYLKRGQALVKTDPAGAIRLLQMAERIWPELPGLQRARQDLNSGYPILRVGVRHLPEKMSPALARTDAERQAVELIFEGLLKPVPDSSVGIRYEPALSVGRPELIGLGRRFQLPTGASWFDGRDGAEQAVTAADVHGTVRLLKNLKGPNADPQLARMLEAATDRDPSRINLMLHRGHFDALSLMTFKVMPNRLKRADDPDFAQHPVGSGPFYYVGRSLEGNRELATFKANPAYGLRPDTSGLPIIQDIRFVITDDPVFDFKNGFLHLLLDLPTDRIALLTSPDAGLQNKVRIHTLRTQRVYFLAVNHRPTTFQDSTLRKAIALSIDREDILTRFFREEHKEFHRPLSGPFPPGSWANDPELDKQPSFDPARAKTLAEKVKAKGMRVTLKYPSSPGEEGRNAATRRACEYIRDQIGQSTGIDVELVERTPEQLREDVEIKHDYELAYYHHDYQDAMYTLWPLFDPTGVDQGGRNYLGYVNDGPLESAFQSVMNHRNFAAVQKFTQRIDAAIRDRMPFIPLWQLDTHIAIHADLKTSPSPSQLDPIRVFTSIEEWKLEKK